VPPFLATIPITGTPMVAWLRAGRQCHSAKGDTPGFAVG
jgi:hypothetical protein